MNCYKFVGESNNLKQFDPNTENQHRAKLNNSKKTMNIYAESAVIRVCCLLQGQVFRQLSSAGDPCCIQE